jgi:hypothetical protein
MTTTLAFVDTETTGLDARIHQPYEVCIWREGADEPVTMELPHTLEHADQQALNIGGYWQRIRSPWGIDQARLEAIRVLCEHLNGVTLVGSNTAFDAAMLTRFIGTPVWHHRLINVAEGAMWLFGWDRPKGLANVTDHLRDLGHEIPEPDHTAEGDVRTTRAVYYALRQEGSR